jgi:NNMT/PNMT/TEMT family
MELKKEIEADFSTFDPKEYLKEYYARGVDFELDQLLRFFYTSHKDIKPQSTFLEFGIGPTIHSLVTAATKVDTIHVCDRLAANLDEIRLWQRGDEGAFNWDAFIRRSLEIEGIEKVTQDDIQSRSALLREKLTYFGFCDAFSNPPLLWKPDQSYDVVQVNFVLESITSSLEKWEMALQNIISLLKPQSTLILSALQDSTYYTVHDKRFPAVNIDETLLMSVLIKYGFREENIEMTSVPANLPYRGYGATIFVKALFQ